MTYHNKYSQHNSGFALLLSLIVLSVVVSVVLSMVEITIKQLRLSTIGKDSEVAFHAANAGVECLRFWRLTEATAFEIGDSVATSCFGVNPVDPITVSNLVADSGPGDVFMYDLKFSWGTPARCSLLKFIVIASDPTAAVNTTFDIASDLPGYPGATLKECPPGGKCTYLSAKGYNTACGNVGNTVGIVEREVLLEL